MLAEKPVDLPGSGEVEAQGRPDPLGDGVDDGKSKAAALTCVGAAHEAA